MSERESLPRLSERGQQLRKERHALGDLWTLLQRFCTERGWDASLYVREDRDQFGRVGVLIDQGAGLSMRAFGNTTNEAIRQASKQVERDGFDA